ncbi:DUF7289 family protein [Natronorubrum sp. DTA28]|uniref:DUF7289 family protein n=1 Tax=Natronorubrum sp. DTA28 TaxID=3447019 RepID=UPI003F86B547
MSIPFGRGAITPSRRGQSTVLGIVLLIGMVAAGSIGILLVAGDSISEIEHESEQDRVESAFVQLSQQMSSASSNSDVPRTMDMDIGDSGAVVMSDTGNLRIQGGDVDENISIGAIEYTGDDGTKIAYQSGGVFRETGSETRVVSAPPLQYDADSETLSFPIIKTRGEAELNSGDISVTHYDTNSMQNASLVENDTVTVEVTSEYYRGWEDYFEQQGGATTVQDVEVHDDESGTVTAEFGFHEISDAFRTGAIYATDFETGGNADIEDNMTTKAAYPSLSDQIDVTVNDAIDGEFDGEPVTYLGVDGQEEDNYNNFSDDERRVDSEHTLGEGVYFTEEIVDEETAHLDFDLSKGNATLIVNGTIEANGRTITVSENENNLNIYATGNYNGDNGGVTCVNTDDNCQDDVDGTSIQLVLSEDSSVDIGPGGNARFEGVIYAGGTRGDWNDRRTGQCSSQICIHSNPSFYGSVVAASVDVQAAATDFNYDENLQEADLSIYPYPDALPPQITYLNVAEHQVDIEGN